MLIGFPEPDEVCILIIGDPPLRREMIERIIAAAKRLAGSEPSWTGSDDVSAYLGEQPTCA